MPLILPATKYSTIGYFIVIGLFQIIVLSIYENYFQFVIVVGGGGARRRSGWEGAMRRSKRGRSKRGRSRKEEQEGEEEGKSQGRRRRQ